jgi:hypothetical protein
VTVLLAKETLLMLFRRPASILLFAKTFLALPGQILVQEVFLPLLVKILGLGLRLVGCL